MSEGSRLPAPDMYGTRWVGAFLPVHNICLFMDAICCVEHYNSLLCVALLGDFVWFGFHFIVSSSIRIASLAED